MKETVHILATVRKAELLPAALLVFRTLRVGFPEASVQVWGNGLTEDPMRAVQEAAAAAGARFANLPATVHDGWVEGLLQRAMGPFWICDTDVVFWGSLRTATRRERRWNGCCPVKTFGRGDVGGPLLAGRLEPEFEEALADGQRVRHVERLHTAVMWLDAPQLRAQMRRWMCQFPEPWRATAEFPFVRQCFVPAGADGALFYDTCAGLWQAGFGQPFTADQDEQFEHLHCGTWPDKAVQYYRGLEDLGAMHRAVYANPEAALGLRAVQERWYREHRPTELRERETV